MIIKIDNDIELRQLERTDAIDIFEAIDTQREYLGDILHGKICKFCRQCTKRAT